MENEDRQLQAVVNTGLMFVRALTLKYGPEDGNSIWESICANLDVEAKGAIMFAMLSGKAGNVVTLRGIADINNCNKVAAIKAIRSATGLGLKEAKDIVDIVDTRYPPGINTYSSYRGPTPPEIQVKDFEARTQLVQELNYAGYSAD